MKKSNIARLLVFFFSFRIIYGLFLAWFFLFTSTFYSSAQAINVWIENYVDDIAIECRIEKKRDQQE